MKILISVWILSLWVGRYEEAYKNVKDKGSSRINPGAAFPRIFTVAFDRLGILF